MVMSEAHRTPRELKRLALVSKQSVNCAQVVLFQQVGIENCAAYMAGQPILLVKLFDALCQNPGLDQASIAACEPEET
jgi:hypothetical protein